MQLPQLEDIRIASPCPMSWDEMAGDDRTRFCEMCKLHVHNITGMTRDEATELIRNAEGSRLCVRMYRRADGTILTQDCPIGLRAIRQKMVRGVARVAAILLFGASAAWAAVSRNNDARERIADMQPFTTIRSWFAGKPKILPPPQQMMVMGDICFTPAPTNTPTSSGNE
ncbi:MAG: hypothetical protein H6815_09370 [Phycisphaeraceae bacterium]|nr:hypothetical protein [Phycisphaerales bacterium]MCB9860647.1 hypothetical protein [Phycisphaeraceae bacterium]